MAKRIGRCLIRARHRAKRKGLAFTITADSIDWPEFCPVFGSRLLYDDLPPTEPSVGLDIPSIDRLDPAVGYVPGNCRVISWRANRLKSDASIPELRALLLWLTKEVSDGALC